MRQTVLRQAACNLPPILVAKSKGNADGFADFFGHAARVVPQFDWPGWGDKRVAALPATYLHARETRVHAAV
jgi:hypothetical protein